MWTRITEENWLLAIEKLDLPLFYQPNYLNAISNSFKLELNYFSFTSKHQVISLFSFFTDSKNALVIPEAFSYSPFYINKSFSEKLYIDVLSSLIDILKKEFKSIKIKLPTDILDIRPFIWENFKIDIKYTHEKIGGLSPDASIIKNLTKDVISEYDFKVEDLTEHSLSLNLEFLSTLDFSTKKISRHRYLIQAWAKHDYLKAFNLYRDNVLICSNLVLLDFNSSKAYTILLNKVDAAHKFAHTYLYDQIIKWCVINQINNIDFCGANFKTISEFKSRFSTELKSYYVVNYSPISSFLKKIEDSLSKIFRKI